MCGQQECLQSSDAASSYWANCEGSIGPLSVDSCTVDGDDSDCDGNDNSRCACIQNDSATCAGGYGYQGDCGEYMSCGANGQWPAASGACAAKSGDSCAPASECLGGVFNSGCAKFGDVCFQ